MNQPEELLKKPLYVYDLPAEILLTLQPKDDALTAHNPGSDRISSSQDLEIKEKSTKEEDGVAISTSCALCGVNFANAQAQRSHVKSDFHGYNVKQKIRASKTVNEAEFEKLVDDLDESISGSDSDSSDQDNDEDIGAAKGKESTLTNLLKKQARLSNADDPGDFPSPKKSTRGSSKPPLLWFTTPLLTANYSLGIYRALFTDAEQKEESHAVDTIREKQVSRKPSPKVGSESSNGAVSTSSSDSPHVFLCMVGGGHFAGMVVSLAPKIGKKHTGADERQATVLAHKTFHRYTTRRKQGGAQSSNDASKGAAHSAGSSLRRYNEVALTNEIRELLSEWKPLIDTAQLLFIRATGTTNRRTLYGSHEGQSLHHNDPRIRGFPFSTRRATQAELMRSFVELTRVKVSQVDEAALAAGAAAAAAAEAASTSKPGKSSTTTPPPKPRPSKAEEAALLHTSQIQSLIRRSKAPALLTYLNTNSLSADFPFHPVDSPQNHHAPTPLHLAASINSPTVVLALLTKAAAEPMLPNADGRPAFDLAGDRVTRDAFRVARAELGESRWDWGAANVPPALSRAEAEKREERDRGTAEKAEASRRQEEIERLGKEDEERRKKAAETEQKKRGAGKTLGAAVREKTGAEKREQEARGMTPEMRARLERERRARAAEERIARMQQGGGAGTR
ncbi:MAG: hypothetical protein M1837_004570 [Sclerophora amabilis]|nr:MAG: hypothetical protein M1837_004570 [Sclerophora amabilis]